MGGGREERGEVVVGKFPGDPSFADRVLGLEELHHLAQSLVFLDFGVFGSGF
jgi:hypothetical protein